MSEEAGTSRSYLPWLVVVMAVVLAGGVYFSLDRKINALQAASVAQGMSQPANDVARARQTLGRLEDTVRDNQASQQKLADEVADLQRRVASQGGERKLLSDQLGALSSRVDALASAHAAINNPGQKRGRP
ncbi:hypothetical protein [Bradyrhizobium sp. DASA03120]|uniref:hypothetical protein n=1 Tax=Bradyrhizobium sp. SMVTL-02 TaxID=3395917 RepID=UPI003F708167